MQAIFSKLLYEQLDGHDTVLVTLVRENGSAPRGKGAMMLVSKYGRQVGTIGGGAVEKQAEKLALDAITRRESMLYDFKLRPNPGEDIGMICGGDVTAFFQFIAFDDANWNSLAGEILKTIERREKRILTLYSDGRSGQIFAPEESVGQSNHPDEKNTLNAECFFFPVPIGERAILFGAGHISQALAPLLASVGFRVTIMDNREEYARSEIFPRAEKVLLGDYEHLDETISISKDDYLVVMTHGHSFDYEIERQLLSGKFAYLGVIGSAKKTASVNAKLWADGISHEKTDLIHTPVGLKIKAITPEEIAVSIAAEMILERALIRETGN